MPQPASAAVQRRVTRSQSRELDDPNYGKQSLNTATQQNALKGKNQLKKLPPVIEQSPISSHKTPSSIRGSSVVPNTPANDEGNTNISGTTFLAHETDQESDLTDSEDGEVDAVDMADELPDLQQASTRLLELVGTNSSDAKGICEVAKRISKPGNADNKRFKRVHKKLAESMKVFARESYIDAARISALIPSVITEDAPEPWDPRPYLYRANCAWLALTTLSAAIGSRSQVQAIEILDRQFPAPFLSRMVPAKQKLVGGASCALKATVDLALEIRTQFFIAELEKRQNEKGFSPQAILKGVFHHALAQSNPSVGPGPLRGFNLPVTFKDENGYLPDSLHDEVNVRIDELETSLFDDDDNFNLNSLKTIFSWRRFCLRVARFVQLREQEFKMTIASQPRIEDVQDLVIKATSRRQDPNASEGLNQSTLVNSYHDEPFTTLNEGSSGLPESGVRDRGQARVDESQSPQANHQGPVSEQPGAHEPAPRPLSQRAPNRRKSTKGIWRTDEAMDFLANSLRSKPQGPLGTLQSPPFNASKGRDAALPTSLGGVGVTAHRDEIAGTPEPELSSGRPGSNRRTESVTQDDEPATQPFDDDLVFDQPNEAVMSASPRGSERINRVSHYPGRFFDSPSNARAKPASPRRSIFDKQANASRVVFSPESSEQSRSAERSREPAKPLMPPPPASQALSRKRGRGDSDDEASDDDFVQDTRSHDIAQRRAQIPERARPLDKRQRTGQEESSPAEQLQEDLVASQQESLVAPSEAPSSAPVRRASRWREENSVPKATVPTSSMQASNFRGRRRWTQEEDDRLIMLVAKHGTQWAVIQRQDQICPASDGGPQLTTRSQVMMKDRARNIKLKYVRNGLPLPPNFDRVTG